MAPQDLTTTNAVRAFLQKQSADTAQDSIIASLITRASDAILNYAGREFAPATTAQARTFAYTGSGFLDVAPFDLRAVTAIAYDPDVSSTTLSSENYRLWPYHAPDGVYTAIELNLGGLGATTCENDTGRTAGPNWRDRQVRVTGNWGFAEIPEDVQHWAIVAVSVWLRRDVAAFERTFSLPEDRLERPMLLPSAVMAGLAHWRRTPLR